MKHRVKAADVPTGGARVFELDGVEVVVFHHGGLYRALGHRCPHAGGPLALGKVEGNEVICPWHGARFDLDCGRPARGPAAESVPAYPVRLVGEELEIDGPI